MYTSSAVFKACLKLSSELNISEMCPTSLPGCLIIVLIFVRAQANVSTEVESALSTLSETVKSMGTNVEEKMDRLSDALNFVDDKELLEAISGSILQMEKAVKSISGFGTVNLVSVSMDMVSAVTKLIPKYGQVVSAVFGIAAVVLGLVGGRYDTGSIVSREVENALIKYDDELLRAEAEGAMRVYSVSRAYLNPGNIGYYIEKHELCMLASNVPITKEVKFLGELGARIRSLSSKDDKTSVSRAAVYINLYASLAAIRTAILVELYCIIRESAESEWTTQALKSTIDAERKHDEDILGFLTEPDYSKAVFFAYYRPSEWPVVKIFLSKIGKTFQNLGFLSNKIVSIRNYGYLTMSSVVIFERSAKVSTSLQRSASLFYLDLLSVEDNTFYIRSKEWPTEYFIWGAFGGRTWGSRPGRNGQWKITLFGDGKYMLSNLEDPSKFLSIHKEKSKYINDYYSYFLEQNTQNFEPEVNGHWVIEESG